MALPTLLVTALLVLLLGATPAFGQGYAPGSGPGGTPPGSFASVLTTATIGPAGGTLAATAAGVTYTLTIPPGTFPADTQVTLYGPDVATLTRLLSSGETFVTAVSIAWPANVTPTKDVTLIIADPNIAANALVFKVLGSGLTPYSNATVARGHVTVSFSTDPGFVVANPAAVAQQPGQIPSRTVAQAPAQAPASAATGPLPSGLPATGAGGARGGSSGLAVLTPLVLAAVLASRSYARRSPR